MLSLQVVHRKQPISSTKSHEKHIVNSLAKDIKSMLKYFREPKQKLIYSRISGGLGNQFFQYATGRYLSYKNNTQLCIKYQQIGRTKRKLELGRYNIQVKISNRADELKLHYGKFDRCLGSLLRKLGVNYSSMIPIYKENRARSFDPAVTTIHPGILLHGLWQNEEYFASIRDKLLEELSYDGPVNKENADMLHHIVSSDSVSVHIRRDDYMEYGDRFGALSAEYYNIAIGIICSKVKKPHFFVFTLDQEWAKMNLTFPGRVTFVNINSSANGFMDLELMKNCKHQVIANSSFSWWGAWLNQNQKKVVVAPNKWLKSDVYDETKRGFLRDILPETWIKIDSQFE